MDLKSLSTPEIAVLQAVGQGKTATELINITKLPEVQVLRGIQWLVNKKLAEAKESKQKLVMLDVNGSEYKKHGLPEIRFLKSTIENFQVVSDIGKKSNVSGEEINIVIGTLKRKIAIDIQKSASGELTAKITDQGKKLISKPTLEEVFLQKHFPLSESSLTPEEIFALKNLLSRRAILKMEEQKIIHVALTPEGKALLPALKSFDPSKLTDTLTPEMLKDSSWKTMEFRHFDVESAVPKVYGGKRHFVNQAIEYMKQIWIELGFEEMSGGLCQTGFWDLDTLFVPQDHPARQMQDSFFVKAHDGKGILKGTLPKKLAQEVKAVHENGGNTGSLGWGGKWSEDFSSEIMLRTHTTTLSAHYIHEKITRDATGKIIPRKFFSVNKVFRNETPDWKHLFEFNQVEGIVVDPNANFQHLLGYLKLFFKKMGFADVRIKPSHFPYTEPSAEVEVFNQRKGEWVELGGSGIFRPEVTKTLIGEEVPVLAWGLGMERIIVEYFDLHDLRDLYKNDIKQLREMKSWRTKVSE